MRIEAVKDFRFNGKSAGAAYLNGQQVWFKKYPVAISLSGDSTLSAIAMQTVAIPKQPTLLASDSFSGADTTALFGTPLDYYAGGAVGSLTWLTASNIGRLGGKLYPVSSPGGKQARVNTGSVDGYVEFLYDTLHSQTVGCLGRFLNSTVYYRVSVTNLGAVLIERSNPTPVTLWTSPAGVAGPGNRIGLSVVGSTIAAYVNGNKLQEVTNTEITTGTEWGVHIASGLTAGRLDNVKMFDGPLAASLFSGGGVLSAMAVRATTADLIGAGALDAAVFPAFRVLGTLSGDGALSALVVPQAVRPGVHSGEGTLSATAAILVGLSGEGTLSATATPAPLILATASGPTNASRDVTITFPGYVPKTDDTIAVWPSCKASSAGAVWPSGWLNPRGGAPPTFTGVSEGCCVHTVTAAEESGGSNTFTLTNYWNTAQTGDVIGLVARYVSAQIPVDASVAAGVGTATTAHTYQSLTASVIEFDNDLYVGSIARANLGNTYTSLPAGFTLLASSNVNQGRTLVRRGALSTGGVSLAGGGTTASVADAYCTYSILLVADFPGVLRPAALTGGGTLSATVGKNVPYGDSQSVIDNALVPTSTSTQVTAFTLGLRFTPLVDGRVTAIRFYRAPTSTMTSRTVHLWRGTTLVASANTVGESGEGWVTAEFSSSVVVVAGVVHTASYNAGSNTGFSFSVGSPTSVSPDLQAGGAFFNSALNTYPASTTPNNYFADLIFQAEVVRRPNLSGGGTLSATAIEKPWTPADIPGLAYWIDPAQDLVGTSDYGPQERAFTAADPANLSTGNYTAGTRFTPAFSGKVTHIRGWVGGGTHTFSLWDSGGTKIASVVDVSAPGPGIMREVALPTPVNVTAGSSYTASVSVDSQSYGYTYPIPPSLAGSLINLDGYYASGSDVYPSTTSGGYSYHVDVVFQRAPQSPLTDGQQINIYPGHDPLGRVLIAPAGNGPIFRAAAVGGKPRIEFDWTVSQRLYGDNYNPGTTGLTFVFVAQVSGPTNYGMHIVWSNDHNYEIRNESFGYSVQVVADYQSGGPAISGAFVRSPDTDYVIMMRADMSDHTIRLYINDTQQFSVASVGAMPNVARTIYIGHRTDGYYWDGLVAEVLVISGPISTTDRAKLMTYLRAKHSAFPGV